MGLKSVQLAVVAVLLLIASMAAANKNLRHGKYSRWGSKHHGHATPRHHHKSTSRHTKIIVGGAQKWRFGFNYADWAVKNGPFYIKDSLVFKYDAPNETVHPHSVYLLPNLRSFIDCDFGKATTVGNTTQGGGKGFQFVLKSWEPYYFACGERGGSHCKDGMMKFFVFPKIHR